MAKTKKKGIKKRYGYQGRLTYKQAHRSAKSYAGELGISFKKAWHQLFDKYK